MRDFLNLKRKLLNCVKYLFENSDYGKLLLIKVCRSRKKIMRHLAGDCLILYWERRMNRQVVKTNSCQPKG